MATREKLRDLIFFNGISVVGYLCWLGFWFVKALSRAFGSNAHSDGGIADFLLAGVAVAVVGCAIGSYFARAGVGRFVALAPLALILLSEGVIGYQKSLNQKQWAREELARREARKRKLERISKDFIIRGEGQAEGEFADELFLTHDKELNTIVCIESGVTIRATPVGKIDGQYLDTLQPREELVGLYQWHVDREGKKFYERYTLRHRPDLNPKDFQLEKYQR